jgi:EmrB/QacA subfamily drug resistance transporter
MGNQIKNMTENIDSSIYKRRWNILAAMCLSLLLVIIGNSSLNQAIPTLAKELSLTSLQLTWIVDIYPLLFASLLFTFSAVADRYGRKLVMQIGLGVFLSATIYAGFVANSGVELIGARAVMGIGAAMVMPTTLSIIENVFPKKERARAIAIWSGVAGGGIALGSIMTGFLLEHYAWQSVFVFSTILGAVGFIFNQWITPNSRDEKQTPIDWLSGGLSTIGLLGLVYGIIEAPSHGITDTPVMLSLLAGIAGVGLFIWRQLRIKHPMLDMKLFKIPAFSISALSVTLTFFSLMGIFFSISQLFQLIMGYSTLEASFRMLPIFLLMMLSAPFVPNIVKKYGTRWTVTAGLVLVSGSFLIMSQWPTVPQYWQVLGSMLVMMTGMSLTMTPATNMLMSAIPRNRAGMGSAMNDTTRELGGALGIAVLGAVLSSVYSNQVANAVSKLPVQIQETASNSLAGALAVAEKMGPLGDGLSVAAKTAWMNGLSRATIIASAIVGVAAIVASIWLPHRHEDGADDEVIEVAIEA